MVRAVGPAAGMTMPRMAIVAVAAIGMFVAVMMLLGMSRRGTQPTQGHRIRARTRHKRSGSRPPAARVSPLPSAQRPPAAPLNLRPPAQRPSPTPLNMRAPAEWPPAAPASLRPSAHASQDRADRAGSSGYRPPSLWRDVPDDPHGWR
ncbi:MAG: hypothetical protein ACRDOU_14275 [Streptosporangiaceae bacterium]